MAWIESHDTLKDHPKTRRFRRSLGVNLPQVIGHLHLLWWWALEYAENGDLSKYDAADIAEAAGWDGDADDFLGALVDAGFVDKDDNDGFSLHDWHDYAGRLIEKREQNRERQRRYRLRQRQDGGEGQDVSRDDDVTRYERVTNDPTITVPKPNNNIDRHPPSPADGYTDEFESWWAEYPRKVQKRSAFNAWRRVLKKGPGNPTPPSIDDLRRAVRNYAAECQRNRTETNFIMHASTFLSVRERRFEDYVDGVPAPAETSERPGVPPMYASWEQDPKQNPYRRVHT